MSETIEEEVTAPIPLRHPAQGTPPIIDTESAFSEAIKELSEGSGPFAIDAERASGFRYSARAYLIQIKRIGGGLHLIDPIAFGPNHKLFKELNDLLALNEVILHASTQDLPCLREIGINPTKLFDTELGARIAGLPRVGLSPLLESLMGFSLAKEHSAADWSTRPLARDWLTYAALDVELLIELRNIISELLSSANKLAWAQEEFEAILKAPPPAARIDPWRRTSGMHKIKQRDQLAIIKDLWIVRDSLAAKADIASGKLLSDLAIVQLAITPPTDRKGMEKALRPLGTRARWFENTALWLETIANATQIPEDLWPPMRSSADTLPPIKIWRERFPEKFAPLSHARYGLEIRAQELAIPLENLITPELIRRICWDPPAGSTQSSDESAVRSALAKSGARQWQIDIAAPIVALALLERIPRPEPVVAPENAEGAS